MATKMQRRPIPTGGIVLNVPPDQLAPAQSPALLNVRFRFGEVRPGPGRAPFAPAVASPIQEIARFSVNDTTKWLVMLTDQHFYKWGVTSPGDQLVWTDVGGVALTGSGRWSWCTGEDCFFFARLNGGGIYRWKGGVTVVDMVPNAPTEVRFIEYFNNRLMAGNVAMAGQSWANRVVWPMNGDHTTWTGNGAGFLDLYEPEQEPIQGMKVLSNHLTVFREHSITDLIATGTLTPVFQSEQRTSNVGCIFPFTIDCNGILIFFMGNDGNMWAWNGSQLQSIGDALYKTFENVVDIIGGRNKYFGKIYPYMNEYWLWLGGPYVYIFDFLNGVWLTDYFPNIAAIGDTELYVTPNSWTNATGNWLSWATMWNSMTDRAASRLVVGLTDNTTVSVGKDISGYGDGTIIDAYVDTKDYYSNESISIVGAPMPDSIGPMVQRTIERLMLMYDFNSDTNVYQIGLSIDRGDTWEFQTIIPNKVGLGLTSWKVTGPMARYRVRCQAVKPVFRWRGWAEEFTPGGPYVGLDQNAG